MSETYVTHTKPLSRMQCLSESRGGVLRWQNLFLVIVQSAINETAEGHSILTIGYIYKDRKSAHLLLVGEKDGFSCTCKSYLPPILYQ